MQPLPQILLKPRQARNRIALNNTTDATESAFKFNVISSMFAEPLGFICFELCSNVLPVCPGLFCVFNCVQTIFHMLGMVEPAFHLKVTFVAFADTVHFNFSPHLSSCALYGSIMFCVLRLDVWCLQVALGRQTYENNTLAFLDMSD